jgi:very-short-patch-repair endonuclease
MVHAPPQIRSLWSWLRNRRFGDYKFRRHDNDQARTRYLERQGIMVVRIENETFRRDPDNIGDVIQWAIDQLK